ncbi:uncharacterized protein LOC117789881 [Drosophila innubila]|uniref:uncharacterized protein LOC117789881 n=1 Tax=Drosophila innubila TaxID=198719 RepID=UPI00148CB9CB|nr:uncharacterized protein LOC117789881 [Drosophila innubila]
MFQVLLPLLLLSAICIAAPSQLQLHSELQSASQSASQSAPQQRASDLDYTPIRSVTDDERYTVIHPDVKLVPLTKVKHGKGNIVFSAGQRISGDKLLVNNYDDESFTKAVNLEVFMRYPLAIGTGSTLTSIEIYVDSSANDADAYFTAGGIGKTTASILLTSDQTRTFSYEAFFYGYLA